MLAACRRPDRLRWRIAGIYAVLLIANAGAWLWAVLAFRDHPVLLASAVLAYTLGLRHAVDADHIAAIDNVTRKLMQEGKRPIAVGFFFSLGHSTVVMLIAVAVCCAAAALQSPVRRDEGNRRHRRHRRLGVVPVFAGAVNLSILIAVVRTFRAVRAASACARRSRSAAQRPGPAGALFRPLFRIDPRAAGICFRWGCCSGWASTRPPKWRCSASRRRRRPRDVPFWSIMVFPALFTAGMSLVDTTDGALMLGAYGWAFVKPIRKLYYNMTITLVSVLVALLVGGIEVLGLAGDQFGLQGPFWAGVASLNSHFGAIGYLIIAVFILSWLLSAIVYRMRGYDRLELGSR